MNEKGSREERNSREHNKDGDYVKGAKPSLPYSDSILYMVIGGV